VEAASHGPSIFPRTGPADEESATPAPHVKPGQKHADQIEKDSEHEQPQPFDWKPYAEQGQAPQRPGQQGKPSKNEPKGEKLPWDSYGPKPPNGVDKQTNGFDWHKYAGGAGQQGPSQGQGQGQGQGAGADWQKYAGGQGGQPSQGYDWQRYAGGQGQPGKSPSKHDASAAPSQGQGYDWQRYAGGQGQGQATNPVDWQKYTDGKGEGQGADWQKYAGGNSPSPSSSPDKDEKPVKPVKEERPRTPPPRRPRHDDEAPDTVEPPPMQTAANANAALDSATVNAQAAPASTGMSFVWVLPLMVTAMIFGAVVDRKLIRPLSEYSSLSSTESFDV